MSFDQMWFNSLEDALESQSLSSRAMSFDWIELVEGRIAMSSQSLSSRAMSFDAVKGIVGLGSTSQSLSSRAMSFDAMNISYMNDTICLNPFRAGRCLSTKWLKQKNVNS